MAENNILAKLDGLESRYEEVSTLITDPNVIADQARYVKLTKEYKDLGDIMTARKKYIDCLNAIKEAKDILANESDPDKIGLALAGLGHSKEQQNQSHTPNKGRQQEVAGGGQHALNGIDI